MSTFGREAESEFAPAFGIERLEPGRQHHGADVQLDGFLRLVVVDGARLADLGAEPALARLEMDAVLAVDHRHARRGLGMGQVDARPGGEVLVEIRDVGLHPARGDRGQVDGPRRTDERAGPARLALVGPLVEGRAHFPRRAAAVQVDGAAAHHLAAHPGAQTAQDALAVGRRRETGWTATPSPAANSASSRESGAWASSSSSTVRRDSLTFSVSVWTTRLFSMG